MGEPGTSGDGGGSSGEASSSTPAGAEGGAAGGSGGAGACCSTADLDPAVVASMTADELKKFIETGRTGRRNALPDVSEHGVITTSTSGVAEALESLSVGGSGKNNHINIKTFLLPRNLPLFGPRKNYTNKKN